MRGWEGLTEGWLTGLQVYHGAALGASVQAAAPWLLPGCSGQMPALALPGHLQTQFSDLLRYLDTGIEPYLQQGRSLEQWDIENGCSLTIRDMAESRI